jgi:hypothetical protein
MVIAVDKYNPDAKSNQYYSPSYDAYPASTVKRFGVEYPLIDVFSGMVDNMWGV